MKILLLALLPGLAISSAALAQTAPSPTASASPPATSGPNQKLKDEQEKLNLQNTIAEQKLKAELANLTAEKQRLEAANALAAEKHTAELAELKARIAKQNQEAEAIKAAQAVDAAKRTAALETELADLRATLERKKLANDLAAAEWATKSQELARKTQEADARLKEIQVQRGALDMEVAKFNNEIDLWEKRKDWQSRVARDVEYTTEPFKDGVLTVSDRRISLNGPIFMDTADYVCERIDYFNNQNPTYPIFIVIDSSPGGSVMAGYRILKAMDGSPAPVYVVVKSFAASMAAGITTLAKKSYAYPNAILLHHQLAAGNFGNLTEQRENVKEMEEWWRRLATPVAKKMGLSLEEFVKKMYANTATGDWREFADKAKSLKWVDQTVETIREQSLTKNPDLADAAPRRQARLPYLEEKVDADGRHYTQLPRLAPFDCYYLYNPTGYYRVAK